MQLTNQTAADETVDAEQLRGLNATLSKQLEAVRLKAELMEAQLQHSTGAQCENTSECNEELPHCNAHRDVPSPTDGSSGILGSCGEALDSSVDHLEHNDETLLGVSNEATKDHLDQIVLDETRIARQAVAAQLALQVEWEAAVTMDVDALLSTLKQPDITLSVLEIDEIVAIETAQAQKKALARANMMQTQPD